MQIKTHDTPGFISYPINRVVGTIADAKRARAATEALIQAGVDREHIDVLHGESDLHRLDPSGAEHGFLAQFQRTLLRLAGPVEESAHLRHHVEDVRAGRFVIMVLAPGRVTREVVAGTLNDHGAEFVGFYGRWAWKAMAGTVGEPSESFDRDSSRAQFYKADFDDAAMRLRFDFDNEIVEATITKSDGTVHRSQSALRRLT